MLNALKKISSFFLLKKKKKRSERGSVAGRGSQPVFTSRSAAQREKRVGLLSRIGSWFQSSARRSLFRERHQGALGRGQEWTRAPLPPKNRTRALLVPAGLLAFAASLVFAVQGPLVNVVSGLNLFKIREITITGCRITTPSLIRELAGIRYQSSLVTLNPAHIEAIIRAHPRISAAEVKRDWPDVLVISIKEHVAEALILQEVSGSQKFFYLDKDGVVFAPVEPGQDMDFPVITGLEVKGGDGPGRPETVGVRDDGSNAVAMQEMLREPLAFLKLIRQNNPNLPIQNLSEIHVDRDAGMTLYLADHPFPVYFGKGEVRTKYSRLKRVLEILYKDTAQGMTIADVAYIRMDYLENKVLVAHSGSG